VVALFFVPLAAVSIIRINLRYCFKSVFLERFNSSAIDSGSREMSADTAFDENSNSKHQSDIGALNPVYWGKK